jgi:hypothetical protein
MGGTSNPEMAGTNAPSLQVRIVTAAPKLRNIAVVGGMTWASSVSTDLGQLQVGAVVLGSLLHLHHLDLT